MPPARRAAIFDFDGTIADSLGEVAAVYNEVAVELGMPALATADYPALRQMSPGQALRTFGIPLRKVPRLVNAVRLGMHKRIEILRPFAGMPAAIRRIQENGFRCGILSSNSPDNVHHFLQQHRLATFDWFACGASLFGKTARLRRLVRQTGLPRSEVFFIGDEIRDIAAATEVGVRSIAVSWGYAAREAIAAAQPTFIADTPEQLAEYIIGARSLPSLQPALSSPSA